MLTNVFPREESRSRKAQPAKTSENLGQDLGGNKNAEPKQGLTKWIGQNMELRSYTPMNWI